jgi:hypothetical protein
LIFLGSENYFWPLITQQINGTFIECHKSSWATGFKDDENCFSLNNPWFYFNFKDFLLETLGYIDEFANSRFGVVVAINVVKFYWYLWRLLSLKLCQTINICTFLLMKLFHLNRICCLHWVMRKFRIIS